MLSGSNNHPVAGGPPRVRAPGASRHCRVVTPVQLRPCSVSSQSMWIEWDWVGLNPKQVKVLLNIFQSHTIHV
jgi:hypothetical protein